MEERRREQRHRTLKTGQIVTGARSSTIECTVRNLSSDGALLLVPSLVAIPSEFDLVIASASARHTCRIVWRGDNRVGVEFVAA